MTSQAPEGRPPATPPADDRPSQTWFDQPPLASVPPSIRPSDLPPARSAGAPLASAVAGMLGGMIGGTASLVVYVAIARTRITYEHAALVVSAGAVFGGLFGRVSRRLFRPTLRVVCAVALTLSSWLVAYAFVLTRFVPGFGRAVSFLPTILAALAYGVCVGAVPPVGTRSERGRSA